VSGVTTFREDRQRDLDRRAGKVVTVVSPFTGEELSVTEERAEKLLNRNVGWQVKDDPKQAADELSRESQEQQREASTDGGGFDRGPVDTSGEAVSDGH
jgi:hypothetical protein